jgi:hypothetical protein
VSSNPHVFVVGSPRSGTTLLERVLDAHRELAVVHETRWIPDFFRKRVGIDAAGRVTPALAPALAAHRRFHAFGVSERELESLARSRNGDPVPYDVFVTRLFDRYGSERGKRLVGDKTPRYGRWIGELHELFPRARFIHLIRDGRDVYLSARDWITPRMKRRYPTWRTHPAVTAALWWKRNVALAREGSLRLGGRLVREARYEALVANPRRMCADLCDFLELAHDDAMARFHERNGRRPITAGLRDWKTQLARDELERFEAAAGDLLEELGYPRACSRPGRAAAQEAALVRDLFDERILERGAPLPRGW